MDVFQGQPIHGGVAIAAAARLTFDRLGPSLHPERRRRAAAAEPLGYYDSEPEPSQVILVTDRLYAGLAGAPMPGLEVLGIAVAEDADPQSAPYPIVAGLGNAFLENIAEFDILILDGDRGRIYLDPDAAVIARHQAPAARARVYFVDSAHLPARTGSSGVRVEVLAITRTVEDIALAMRSGADGVYLPPDNVVFGSFDKPHNSDRQTETWRILLDEVGALAIVIDQELERLALSPMLRACAEGQVRLITPPWLIEDVRDQFADTEIFLQDGDEPFVRPLLVAGLPLAPPEDVASLDFDDFEGVAVLPAQMDDPDATEMIVTAARRSCVPVHLLPVDDADSDFPTLLRAAVGQGVSQVTAHPEEIERVKEIIRSL